MSSNSLAALCGTVAFLACAIAHADESAAQRAEQLFDQGRALLQAGDAAAACPKFEQSQALDPALGTILNLGWCYQSEERWFDAYSTFERAIALARGEGHPDAERIASERAERAAAHLPKLRVLPSASTPQPALFLDGAALDWNGAEQQWPLAPGAHTLSARAPGSAESNSRVQLPDDGTAIVTVQLPALVRLAPTPAPEPARPKAFRSERVLAIGAGALGVAGVVVGTVFGLNSASKRDAADAHCDGPRCRDDEGMALRRDAVRAGNWSTVAFAVGGVGLAAGVTLWLWPSAEAANHTSLRLGPNALYLNGAF